MNRYTKDEQINNMPFFREADRKQTLLFVDYGVPQYDIFAGSRTNFMYLTLLVKMGLEVKFLSEDFRRVEPYSSELNDLGIETLDGEWYQNNWQRWLRDKGCEIDYVFFHKPDPAMNFLKAVKKYTNAAIIYQCHDLHYLRLRRKAQVENSEAILAEANLYEKKENFIFSSSDVILTFSEVEEQLIKNKFPHKQVFTMPLFFYEDISLSERDFSKRKDLLFVGGFAHAPNRDAVSWFCAKIFRLIQKQIPDIVLNVVGENPPKDINALQSKSIRILGRVSEDKLKGLYEDSRLAVIPLRFGAGVKGKTIEALYHGVPVVSTSIGLEGIKGIDKIYKPHDDPAVFAAQLVSLYRDQKRLKELSKRGAEFVAETYTLQKTAKLMNEILSSSKKEFVARFAATAIPESLKEMPRLIAFYLPQYHPIPENDEWWGKGFTEWRNVAKARPLLPGHYQPHLPADLGFYDLRLEETRIAQAELAREYGIYGFCYYHYWFAGKRLLERPINDMLESGKPDFPFCLCRANENWTRRWDGEDQHILMKMDYSEEDDRRHIRELFRVFEDKRYIRINGKPFFLVYRTENIPDPGRTAEVWRAEAKKAGIGELYLCRVESIGRCDPRTINFDASLEFAPDWSNKGRRVRASDRKSNERLVNFGITNVFYEKNYVHYYDELADNMMKKPIPDYTWFRCITPSWDNSARRQEGAHIFLGSTPDKYGNWLKQTVEQTKVRLSGDEKIVFVNAWNEWAEGNHLEPDQYYGRAYLEATNNALITSGQEIYEDRESEIKCVEKEIKNITVLKHDDLPAEAGRQLVERLSVLSDHKKILAKAKEQLIEYESQLSERDRRMQDLLSSYSWKITGPLRWVHERLSKFLPSK